MTKKALLELLQKRLGPVDGKYYQVVEGYASLAWEQLLNEVFNRDIKGLDFYAKEFSGTTKVSVTKDTNRDRYYSTLPCPIVQLSNKNHPFAGVRTISTEQADSLEFCPTNERDEKLKAYQTSHTIDDMIYFKVRYDKIWYDENMTDLIADYGVRMVLVPTFDYYSASEEIPIPGGQSHMFIKMVLEIATGMPPEDVLNDNTEV